MQFFLEPGNDFRSISRVGQMFRSSVALSIVLCFCAPLTSGTSVPPSSAERSATGIEPVQQPDRLVPFKPVVRKIGGGASHKYKLDVRANQAVSISVAQRGIDLEVVLRDPKGTVVLVVDSPNGSFGNEEFMMVAAVNGDHELQLRPFDPDASQGSYTATIRTVQNAAARDKTRFEALQSIWAASDLRGQGDRASYEAALKKYAEAFQLFRRIGSVRGQAVALSNIGFAEYEMQNYKAARSNLERSLPLWRAVREIAAEANVLSTFGLAAAKLKDTKAAEGAFQRAIVIQRRIGDKKGEADTLNNLGLHYKEIGEYPKAVENLSRALVIYQAFKNASAEADVTAGLAAAYADFGTYEKALSLVRQVQPLLETQDKKAALCSAKITEADINFVLGNRTRAAEIYSEAIALARAIGDRGLEARLLNNIGLSTLLTGDIKKSRGLFETALEIAKTTDEVLLPAYITRNIGRTFFDAGDPAKAIEYYSMAALVFRSGNDPQAEAQSANYTGRARLAQGEPDRAILDFEKALEIARRVGDKTIESDTLANLFLSWKKEGSSSLAIAFGKQAVNGYQAIRYDIKSLDKELQKSFLTEKESVYRLLAEMLIEQGRIIEAEHVIAMLKDEEYSQFILRGSVAESRASQRILITDEDAVLLAQYKKYRDRITAMAKEFGELEEERRRPEYDSKPFPKQARLDELNQRLEAARAEFAKFLEQMKLQLGNVHRRIEDLESGLRHMLKGMMAKNTAVVSTVVGIDKLSIIVTTPDVQTAQMIPVGSKEVNMLVADFRAALSNVNTDPRTIGRKLYDILVKPIEKDLAGIETRTIVWSMDGTLRYIPPAALWDGNKYLAESYANVIITPSGRYQIKDTVMNRSSWKALGVGTSKSYEDFRALNAVPDELDCIVTDSETSVRPNSQCRRGVVNGRKLIDETFTKQAFKHAIGRYPFVHIASHFSFQPGDGRNSFLLLGGGADRKLMVSEINQTMFNGVELLTLSACNTAVGSSKSNGVEIENFGRIAQDEGAKSVIATLWAVADPSTRDLMVRFYSLYSSGDGSNKAESLRSAQLAMINGNSGQKPPIVTAAGRAEIIPVPSKTNAPVFVNDPNKPYAHPYYWAPFVLMGNWN